MDNPYTLDRYHYERARMDGRDERKYCETGCDFIARFEFANGEVARVMVPGSFRRMTSDACPAAEATDPLSAKSFRTDSASPSRAWTPCAWTLYAPRAWEGVHARVPQLLASWTKERGGRRRADVGELRRGARGATRRRHVVPRSRCRATRTTAPWTEALPFVRALEEAMFEPLGGNDRLPDALERARRVRARRRDVRGRDRRANVPAPPQNSRRREAARARLRSGRGCLRLSARALDARVTGASLSTSTGTRRARAARRAVSAPRKVWPAEARRVLFRRRERRGDDGAGVAAAITDGWEAGVRHGPRRRGGDLSPPAASARWRSSR